MLQLVETSEDDTFTLVATHVSNLLNDGQVKTALADTPGSTFLDAATAAAENQRWDEYILKLAQHLDLVFAKSSDKDCESIANVLVHAIVRLQEDKQEAAAKALATALSSKIDERSEERLTALLNLYGVTSVPAVQHSVLMTALEFARKHPKLATQMAAVTKGRAEQLVRVWGLGDAQARDLYVALAAVVKASVDRAAPREYLRLMTVALGLAGEKDTQALAQLKPHAVAAVADFVRNPGMFQCDLAELPAIKQLASDAQHKPLYALLNGLLSGDMAVFKAAATPAALEQAGVSVEAATQKARMIALLALGSKAAAAHEDVAFADVQKALDIPAEQVETWVVRAIGSKLMEGRIDQVRGAVSVTRCTQRTFGAPEWASLRSQLAAWKEGLSGVIASLAQQQQLPPVGGASSGAAPASAPAAIKAL